MNQIYQEVTILFPRHRLSDYELCRLGEAIDLIDYRAQITINGKGVTLPDMLNKVSTWDDVWDKFDQERLKVYDHGL